MYNKLKLKAFSFSFNNTYVRQENHKVFSIFTVLFIFLYSNIL